MKFGWFPLCVMLGACGARPAQEARPAAPAARARATAEAAAWSQASWEERHDRMTWMVLPSMARSFQAFAGTQYPELSCFSCHGADAEQVQYRMPHGLPPLDPEHLPNPHSTDARQARYAAFMTNEVTPRMAELLEKPDVSCFTCHPRVGGG